MPKAGLKKCEADFFKERNALHSAKPHKITANELKAAPLRIRSHAA
jgi:hypothetical protein